MMPKYDVRIGCTGERASAAVGGFSAVEPELRPCQQFHQTTPQTTIPFVITRYKITLHQQYQ